MPDWAAACASNRWRQGTHHGPFGLKIVFMSDGAVLAVLAGVLERVTFANPETGYTIARIVPVKREGRWVGALS